uniref:Putative Leucine-rich repeat (LRR) protein, homolog of Volvox carteri MTF0684/MTM0041 n=1 Tax=Yamagishiella unicocca TaxID=51707 RepID=A0A2Z5X882_9CHLO|nr:putative Leucine-rich repeat (LRR) protein, homolog of Volvox carteri MTF0684/MTM0041 [Yamagishiella unicocca]
MSLTSLDVSFNQLHELPACLGALTLLTCLRAQYNQIERVHPQAFSGLGGCLVELHLGDNALGSLPAEVGCLSRLARLDLRYTRLTELPAELSRLGDVGCLQQLGLEGCPLGAAQEGRPEGRPATAGTPREQQQQQALYRRIRKAAADTEAAAGGAVAGQALAEVLKQLGTTAQAGRPGHEAAAGRGAGSSSGGAGSRSQPPAAAGPGPGSAAASTGAPAAGGGARKVNVLSLGSGGSGAGATSSSGPGGGGGVAGGAREQGDASRGTAAEPNAGAGPRYAQLQPLQLHSAAAPEPGSAARGSGGGDVRAQGRPRRQHPGAVPPRSPLTDLRNSHADLELSYVDEDDDEPADDEGINIVGAGGAGAAPPLSPGEPSPGGGAPRAMALALEELSELPPAAAAVMYRSLDMVAAGVQEMREGRPLSRGGTSAGVPLPPNAMRPASSSRPGSQHRRPGSSSSYGDPLRPRTSSSASGLPGSAGGGAPRQPPGEELTGAMALLASVGMRAGGSGGQGAGGTPGRRNPGGDSDAGCGEGSGLGALAPITFPLASGVRGMLRGVSGGRQVFEGEEEAGAGERRTR